MVASPPLSQDRVSQTHGPLTRLKGGKLPTEGGSETETGGLKEPGKAMWGHEGVRRKSTKVQQHLTHCPI